MNNTINRAFLEKIMEAKRMEMEAIMLLLPEHMKVHVEAIGKEIKGMLLDCLVEFDTSQKDSGSSIKKVDIE